MRDGKVYSLCFCMSGRSAGEKRNALETYVRLTDGEAVSLYGKQVKKDFPPEEIKPLWVVCAQMESGAYFCDVMRSQSGALLAYAFVMKHEGVFFLDYFAVPEEERAKGYGTKMLVHLFETYDAPWILEVEDPECAKDAEERAYMLTRIRFYEHAGAKRTAVRVVTFGCPFCLMSGGRNTDDKETVKQQYLAVYGAMLGEKLSLRVRVSD